MSLKENILRFSSRSKTEFVPYYQKENDFGRLLVIWGIAALVFSPLYSYLIKDSIIPEVYFWIGIANICLFPVYMIVCYFIKPLQPFLIYCFITHLFIATFFAFNQLLISEFDLLNIYCFYTLYSIVLFVIQRLYPAILYIVFVLSLLLYGFQFVQDPVISKGGMTGMFITLSLCAVLVLYSRGKMINSVEDYSNYLKKIVNNPGVGYVLFKITGNNELVLDQNQEASRLLECTQDEINFKIFDHFNDDEIEIIKNLKLGTEFEKVVSFESHNGYRSLEFDITVVSLKNGMYWLLRITDLTQKIKEKDEIINREKKYRNLYYRNQAGVFTSDLNSTILDCNEAFEEMFNGEITKGKKLFEDPNKSEWEEILDLIEDRENLRNYQTHMTLKNGSTKWFIFNWYIDKSTGLIEGTSMDLTEVQKASAALRQSEEKYRLIYEESNDAIILLDQDRIIDVNRKGIQLFGIPQRTLLDMNLFDLSFNTDENSKREYKRQKQKLHLSKSTKFNWIFKENQNMIEAEVAFVEILIGDKTYYQCVVHDLTQRNEVMRTLEKNRVSFKSVLDTTPEGILIIHEGEILFSNPEAHRLLEREEIHFNDIFIEEDQKLFIDLIVEQHQEKNIKQRQLLLNRESNELLVDVTLVGTIFEDRDATLVIIKDISLQNKLSQEVLRAELAEESNKKLANEIKERIKTEKLLQEQFLRSNAIFDSSSNTLLITLNTKYEISSFNTHCQTYFYYMTDKRMKVNEKFTEYFSEIYDSNKLRYFKYVLNRVKKGESRQMEVSFISKGSERWLELFMNPIVDIEGKVTEISLVAHDITEKKKSEKEIVESLKEKEILLKEIHHRVKNNLQVISSILNLQSSFVKDEKILEILDESRNRIRSMAIIHENLYRTTNFSSIDFSNYLQNLASNLISSYYVQRGIIHLNTDMEKVELVLDQAIPCGLLVNELITNSIKYAFPVKKEGSIFIGLKEENETIYIRIEDDGIGLPKDYSISESDTLGLQLVSTLVEQLDGEISVVSDEGTKYLITFGKAKL